MNLEYIGWAVLAVILILFIWITFGSSKKKWYMVYLANNDVMLLQRNIRERWWRTSDRYMRFLDENGNEVTFPSNAHWIIKWVEVKDGELDMAREEINRIKANLAKQEA